MGGKKTALALSIITLLAAGSASAQDEATEETSAEAAPEPAQELGDTTAQPAEAAPAPADGGRFRFGINGAVGLESVSAGGMSASGAMFGLDVRLGWQFNELLAIYLQPHLSFGSIGASEGGVTATGVTGTFVGTVMGEATFLNRFFAGAGLGYGIFNNPSGFAIDLRAGGYPLMSHDDDSPGRKGLMLGIDFRTVFLDGATGILFMGCVGYEAF